MTLLIQNGSIYHQGSFAQKNILVEEGKIAEITQNTPKADRTIDASEKIILPGLIDPHVHFRDPGLTHKEDFFTGSCAAAAGGITTILDMPNTLPPTFTVDELEKKRKLASKSLVNYGLHFGTDPENNVDEIKKANNIPGVKAYLNETTGNLLVTDFQLLEEVMKAAPLLMIHAEGETVRKTTKIATRLKKRFYLCHINSKEDIEFARQHDMFRELTPHHLFLTESEVEELANLSLVKPEIQKEEDRNALWSALAEGKIHTIGTDHAPHLLSEKKKGAFGIPGEETMLPLLLNAVNEGKLPLDHIPKLCAENPATIFRIKNKGFIKKGYDADLTIVDLNLEKTVDNKRLFTKCKWSPWHSKTLKGWPVTTVVAGTPVFDGKITNTPAKEVEIDGI